jgi:hypothetical protein
MPEVVNEPAREARVVGELKNHLQCAWRCGKGEKDDY